MKKGIAMVTLVVTIAVMLTLVSVITYTGINTANTSKKMSFASEIKMVQDCIDGYRTNNEGDLPTSDFVTIDITNASIDVKKQFTDNGEEIIDNKVYLSKIDYTKLDLNSLNRGVGKTSDDIYTISTKSGIVYYAKGLKIGNITYYTLTDELKNLLSYNQKSNSVLTSKAIIFETSTNEWSNSKISCKIKIPKEYEFEEPKFNKEAIDNLKKEVDENYNIFSFETEKNGEVEINYKKDNTENTSKFSVNNIDTDIPSVYVSKLSNSNSNKKCLKIEAKDITSGVKIVKYDTGKIDNNDIGKVYFNSNGIEIKDNILEIDKDVSIISIYVEDNAGNSFILPVEI